MKFSENWLRTWINPQLSSAELAHALTMAGLEVEAMEPAAPASDLDLDDTLFTLKLTPNRGDCLSVAGVAREVAAMAGGKLNAVQITAVAPGLTETWPVKVEAPAACSLYCGRIVRGVNAAAATPSWLARRLERSGIRSINAAVDVTNYVMLELGQPLHAFDLAKLSGGITVRYAQAHEELTLLNGQNIKLQDDMLVIADTVRPLALAGIMGGEGSGVETSSRDVFLESAFFAPEAIAGKARRLAISTDSSHRFERGVDFAATRLALERATQLLLEICGGQAGAISEVAGKLPTRTAIMLRADRVKRVLGITLDGAQIAALLQRLQFKFEQQGDDFRVTPPSYRFDLAIEADLIEELARTVGYDNIPAQLPQAAVTMLPQTETQRPVTRLRQIMVARDYQETISYAFLDAQTERELCANTAPVTLKNPIASHLAVMRSSLLGGLVGALRINLARKQTRVRLFETGACFSGEGYAQQERLAGLCYGSQLPEQWGASARNADFYDIKADVEALFAPALLSFVAAHHPASHPGRSAQILWRGQAVGWLGELHPQWMQQYDIPLATVWFEVDLSALMQATVPHATEISRFPPVRRDLAVVVDESVPVQSLLDATLGAMAPHVIEIAPFDLYRGKGLGEGKKSLAFRVLLQDTQKTLTEMEIDQSVARLVAVLQQHGAQLRI